MLGKGGISVLQTAIFFIMYRELYAGIYRKHDQYHTNVKSHLCQQSFKNQLHILIIFTKQINFYIKRLVIYEKKNPNNTNELLKKKFCWDLIKQSLVYNANALPLVLSRELRYSNQMS